MSRFVLGTVLGLLLGLQGCVAYHDPYGYPAVSASIYGGGPYYGFGFGYRYPPYGYHYPPFGYRYPPLGYRHAPYGFRYRPYGYGYRPYGHYPRYHPPYRGGPWGGGRR